MNAIIRTVKDIPADDRRGLENVVGRKLAEDDRVAISILQDTSIDQGRTPPWENFFEGLSEEDIADIERIALRRANLTRAFD